MENREWLNEYVSIKHVNANNPFTVPDGYFDELSDRIAASIKLDELKSKKPLTGFTVPENYFEELNNNIQSRVNIEKVLNNETTGFTVPENYFEELNTQITSRIFIEEALTGLPETLTVPGNYFNELNSKILNKTVNQPSARHNKGAVVRFLSSTAFKYATAACITVMVGAGVILKQAFSPAAIHNRSYLHKELSTIPLDDLQNYLDLNVDDSQHTITSDDGQADDQSLDAALQDYANGTKK